MKSELNVSNLIPTAIEKDHQSLLSQAVILVADDNEDDFIFLKNALKEVEVTASIYWAQNGCEAIGALSKLRTELHTVFLVIDIQLPDINGFALVEKIKEKNPSDALLFVFLTGNENPLFRTHALACGARAFFLKPSGHAEFLDIARQIKEICSKVNGLIHSFWRYLIRDHRCAWLLDEPGALKGSTISPP